MHALKIANMNSRLITQTLLAATGLLLSASGTYAQTILVEEVTRIETMLSSDAMEGRATFSPGIEKAADFIAKEFNAAGLKPFAANNFKQQFAIFQPTVVSGNLTVNGTAVPLKNVHVLSAKSQVSMQIPNADVRIFRVDAGENPMRVVSAVNGYKGNCILLLDTSQSEMFGRIKRFLNTAMPNDPTKVVILSSTAADAQINMDLHLDLHASQLANVAAIIPGKSRPDEYVIFSAHYDHLGYGRPDAKGDSLYNGANDDASGTTAVIALSKYFQQKNDNARTLVFVAFTAEERGGYGSKFFSGTLAPEKVMAMFNIEMIGTDSKWGTNSAYITGFEKSDMGSIMQKNLAGTDFTYHPDPYPQQNLFYRSDNATLARLGVPAHTISTSKMDSEPHYHKASDEIGTLDMQNMTQIIRSIALSSKSIVAGTDTPSRVAEADTNR